MQKFRKRTNERTEREELLLALMNTCLPFLMIQQNFCRRAGACVVTAYATIFHTRRAPQGPRPPFLKILFTPLISFAIPASGRLDCAIHPTIIALDQPARSRDAARTS